MPNDYEGAILPDKMRVAQVPGQWWIFRANRMKNGPRAEYRAASHLARFGIMPFVPSKKYQLVKTKKDAFAPAMLGWIFGAAICPEQVADAVDEDYRLRGEDRYMLTRRIGGDQKLVVSELGLLQSLAEKNQLGGGEREWVPGETMFEVIHGDFRGQQCCVLTDASKVKAGIVFILVKFMSRLIEVQISTGDVEVMPNQIRPVQQKHRKRRNR